MDKGIKSLHVRGQKSWHGEVTITGNREALLALSDALRLAAKSGEGQVVETFYPADGEDYDVIVEPVTEEELKKRSVHYCERRDPEANLLPEDMTRAVVIAENTERETVAIRLYEGIEDGNFSKKTVLNFSGPREKESVLLDVLANVVALSRGTPKYRAGAFAVLVEMTKGILDAYYPSSVFDGSSGDPGPVFIRKVRVAIKGLESGQNREEHHE